MQGTNRWEVGSRDAVVWPLDCETTLPECSMRLGNLIIKSKFPAEYLTRVTSLFGMKSAGPVSPDVFGLGVPRPGSSESD